MIEKGRTLTYQLLPELLTTTEQKIEKLLRTPVKARTATETKSPFSQIKRQGKNQGQDKDPSDSWGSGRKIYYEQFNLVEIDKSIGKGKLGPPILFRWQK